MRKFFAVVKREYKKVVFTWTFLIGTLLAPLLASLFAVVPMIIFSVKGEAQRIVVVEQSGKITERLKANLSTEKVAEKVKEAIKDSSVKINQIGEEQMKNSAEQMGENFIIENYKPEGIAPEQIRRELNERIARNDLDAFLIVPDNSYAGDAKFEFFSRKAGDFVTNATLENALNEAVRSERLSKANISENQLKELSRKVDWLVKPLSETGEEKAENQGGGIGAAFVIGLLIYITLAIYGQAIMGAIVEEKETRIAEILFSSAKPFELMMGKLVGVGLAGLTQLTIWLSSALILMVLGISSIQSAGLPISMPNITPLTIAGFVIFFLLGFFIYATIYALIGSMVTTVQEGGQFALPPILILMMGLYCLFPVTRDPNSTFSFWVSIAPFIAPIVMPVRIMAETPPLWQIGLAIATNLAAIVVLVWLASRVYRVGMLMYGKRATIPEVWKWIRQA